MPKARPGSICPTTSKPSTALPPPVDRHRRPRLAPVCGAGSDPEPVQDCGRAGASPGRSRASITTLTRTRIAFRSRKTNPPSSRAAICTRMYLARQKASSLPEQRENDHRRVGWPAGIAAIRAASGSRTCHVMRSPDPKVTSDFSEAFLYSTGQPPTTTFLARKVLTSGPEADRAVTDAWERRGDAARGSCQTARSRAIV